MRSFSVAGAATDAEMHVVRGRVCDTSDLKLLRAPLILEEPIAADEGGAKPETPASLFVSKTERKTAPTEQDEILRRRWWRTRASCLIFSYVCVACFCGPPTAVACLLFCLRRKCETCTYTEDLSQRHNGQRINMRGPWGVRGGLPTALFMEFMHRLVISSRKFLTNDLRPGKPHQVPTLFSRSKAKAGGEGGWLAVTALE